MYHHLVVSLFHLLLLVVVNFCIIIKCNTLLFFYVILDRLNISNCFRSILRLRDAYFLHYPLYRKCIYSVLAEGSLLQEINKALYFKFKLVSKLLWFVLGLCHPLSRLTLPVCFWPWLVCGSPFGLGPFCFLTSLTVSCTLLIWALHFCLFCLISVGVSYCDLVLFFEWLVSIAEKLVDSPKADSKGEKIVWFCWLFLGLPLLK